MEEKDPRILDAKQDAKRQAQENLQKVFDFFGRENVQINETEE